MIDVPSLLVRAADKAGFNRNAYLEKNIPTSVSDISVFMFFGDIRSSFVLSSLLFKRYREEVKGSKYFIVCTWPGFQGLFPEANEVWTLRDTNALAALYAKCDRFSNTSDLLVDRRRTLVWHFEDVFGDEVFKLYYDDGIKQNFWDKFKNVQRHLLNVPSATILGSIFNQEMIKRTNHKVFVWPVTRVRAWEHGQLTQIKTPKEFWVGFLENLIKNGLIPVVYQNFYTHDVSMDLAEKCIYVSDNDVTKVLAAMRATGCVLDIFSGIDRFAIEARTPFISLDERARYVGQKENEIDGLCCEDTLPRKYIFLFPTIILSGDVDVWQLNIYDPIMAKLFDFIPILDRNTWPSTSERTELVLYDRVVKHKMRKIGTKFIKVINRD